MTDDSKVVKQKVEKTKNKTKPKTTKEVTLQDELNRIQKDLKAPKSQKNDFGKFNYRSAEDILEAYKKIANKTILISSDEVLAIGTRIYIKTTVTLILGEESQNVTAYAREPEVQKGMNDSQITGSASSYSKKYALNSLFAIDDNKDADMTEEEQKSITEMEIHEAAISMIDNVEDLKKYWENNKEKTPGKTFAAMVTKRKFKLNEEKK